MTERGYGEFVRYLGGEITGLGNSLNGVRGIQRRNNAQVPRLISWVEGATGIRKERRWGNPGGWLILRAPNAGGLGSIPGQGTSSHMP